ncbi:YceI family protein [Henriciella aquimarina]|uniref:YceI family protein n=1 Tax=Henriciella aquimarina TaxID=545261 RepID=UPI0009FE1550|nr:YceI family protein [Henriciella aquimarina]
MPPPAMKAACAALALSLAGCASLLTPDVKATREALRPGAYTLDEGHAALVFRVGHMGFSHFVGRFDRFEASLDFDADAPESARLEAIVDMTSLSLPDKAFAETLMGPGWFDADTYPQAIFRSTGITLTGETTGEVTGDLTLHGETHPVTLDVTFNGGANDTLRGAYVTGFSATGAIDRADFGIDKYLGPVAGTVDLSIEAEFMRQ